VLRVRADDAFSDASGPEAREGEAPVEGEALDAVRLMTIHRSKGLEFEIVCVADLGRAPRSFGELLRIGRDGRVGLRLASPGTGRRFPALDYDALGQRAAEDEAAEERRLFYVAMTRARERLILSGAARFDRWPEPPGGGPISWIGPAFVPEIAALVAGEECTGVIDRSEGEWHARIAYRLTRPGADTTALAQERSRPALDMRAAVAEHPPDPAVLGHPVSTLSYSSLGDYRRCGYRFYLERVLRLPGERAARGAESGASGWSGAERGTVVHALLEQLDFRRPVRPGADLVAAAATRSEVAPGSAEEVEDVAALVEAFAGSRLCARLARASRPRREVPFAFALGPGALLVNGFFDVAAGEPDGALLVIDYKSDRLEGATPEAVVARAYGLQRLIYALAGLRSGGKRVEVAHVFLERPDEPATAIYESADAESLHRELDLLAAGVLAREFRVSDEPQRSLCAGCPGEGGLCSWPLEMTRREAVDRLF